MEKHLAGTTKNGVAIFYTSRKFERFSTEMKQLISEALATFELWESKKKSRMVTFSFDRIIGKTSMITLEDYQKDDVLWVYRKGNPRWKAPVYLKGTPRATTKLTLTFEKKRDGIFVVDSYFGAKALPLPGNPKVTGDYVTKCREFWQEHALALRLDEIDLPRSIDGSELDENVYFHAEDNRTRLLNALYALSTN